MERTKTGIKGFDKLVDGGLPKGKIILLSGTPGTCKTIFALQYLYNGATQFNEKGLYISFEERVDNLKRQALQFGWDFDKIEDKVKIVNIPAKSIKDSTAAYITRLVKEHNLKRVVIDSLSALAINIPTTFSKATELNEIIVERFIYNFINDLRDADSHLTTLLISQTTRDQLSRDGVSEFVCDGVIYIKYEILGGEYPRTLIIRKMRETKNDEDVHPLKISKKGLIVQSFKE